MNLKKPVTQGEKRMQEALDASGIQYKMGEKVGPYEVDFLVYDIIIEVDGYSHLLPEKRKIDKQKDQYLKERGFRLIRVKSEETKDKVFLRKLIKSLDKPVNINHNEPITQKPFLHLKDLRDQLLAKEKNVKKSARDEMLDWLNRHSEDIPVSKDEEDS